MLASALKHKIRLLERVATQGPLGQSVVFKPISDHFAAIIPLDVRAAAQYMQMNMVASHKILLRGKVQIDMGVHEILYQTKRYEPTASAKHHGQVTEVIVKEREG